jgi:hypothetical protein
VNGKKYRTFSDANGNYRFPGSISGSGKLQAAGAEYTVPRLGPNAELNLKIRR